MSASVEGNKLPSEFFTGLLVLPNGLERASAYYVETPKDLGIVAVKRLVQVTGAPVEGVTGSIRLGNNDTLNGVPAYDLRQINGQNAHLLGADPAENIEFQAGEEAALERILAFSMTHVPVGEDSLIIHDDITKYAPNMARRLHVQSPVQESNPNTGMYL